MPPHPALKTYETFLEEMAKQTVESEQNKRFFYKQAVWAESERQRHVNKAKKRRDYLRSLAVKDAEEPTQPSQSS